MNTINIIGRLTANPEIKEVKIKNKQTKKTEKIRFVNFSVAVDRYPKNEKEPTDFIQCTAWRGQAELIYEYFKKGSMIGITGELHMHSYEQEIIDLETKKKKKVKRSSSDVLVTGISFCGSKKSEDVDDDDEEDEDEDEDEDDDDDDDDSSLPFDV